MKRFIPRPLTVAAWMGLAACAGAQTSAPPFAYWSLTRSAPRPLKIHVVRVDLGDPRYECVVRVAAAPGAARSGGAILQPPESLVAETGIVAAINANPFRALQTSTNRGGGPQWTNRMPVAICGWAVQDGVTSRPPEKAFAGFLVGPRGCARVGRLSGAAWQAAAGFELVLSSNVVLAGAGARKDVLHPRSAIGVDAAGRFLWLVEADGRQPGTSEGLSCAELGALLRELGCAHGLNLDGGGSSVLFCDPDGRGLRIMNQPSGGEPRPVPVMIAIRRKSGG